MLLFTKKNKKQECEHKYKTIKAYECRHNSILCNESITLHYIQECEICHDLRYYSFEIN